MVRKSEASKLIKIGAERKILQLLNSKEMGLTEIVSKSGYSKSYVNNLLKILEKEGKTDRGVDKEGRKVWRSTQKGYATLNNSWTALSEDIHNMIIKGGSYMRHTDQPAWPDQPLLSVPKFIMDVATYPSRLENVVDIIKVQYSIKDALAKEFLNTINSRIEIPPDSKLIFAYEIDLFAYSDFITKVKGFMNDIKTGADVFSDEKLGFFDNQISKLALFEAYLNNSDLFADKKYREELEKLFKNKEFISALISNGVWSSLLDQKTLEHVISMFKLKKEPLKETRLVKKLIVMTPDKLGFYVPLYDYITIARILNHSNQKLRNRLLKYELENRYRPDKSLVFKIQNEMRGKSK